MQERRNFYRILGVQPDAPVELIRSAYRTLMQKLKMHPDLGGDERDAVSVNQAWQVLRDPERRAEYDCRLLADYDIRTLSAGGNCDEVSRHPHGDNRRNYYRIIGVQPDAPQALIASAYAASKSGGGADPDLLEEAYAVLGSTESRQRYDALLSGEPAEGAVAEEYEPVIKSYCRFCKTPFNQYPNCQPTGMCCECRSPLRPPERGDVDQTRSFQRAQFDARVEIHEYWPGAARGGKLEEFSPDGLCIVTSGKIAPEKIVRVSGNAFKAIARVVYSRPSDTGFRSCMALLTVGFTAEGMLIDVSI